MKILHNNYPHHFQYSEWETANQVSLALHVLWNQTDNVSNYFKGIIQNTLPLGQGTIYNKFKSFIMKNINNPTTMVSMKRL